MSASPKRAKVDVDRLKHRFSDLFDADTPSVGDDLEQTVATAPSNRQSEPVVGRQPLADELEREKQLRQQAELKVAELEHERELRLQAEQKLAQLEHEHDLRLAVEEKLREVETILKSTKDQLGVAAQKSEQLQAKVEELTTALEAARKQLEETAAGVEPMADIEVDVEKFLTSLKSKHTTRSNGTSHYVAQSVDDWLDQIKDEFYIFGRSRGPNEAQYYWNIGVMLLIKGLDKIPNWQEQVRSLAYSPDLALAEIWKLALKGLTQSN